MWGLKSLLGKSVTHTLGADAHLVLRVIPQETLDTATGKLFQRRDESVLVPICMNTRWSRCEDNFV